MAKAKDVYTDEPVKGSRQQQIEALEIGGCVSVSARIDIKHGFAEGAIKRQADYLRGGLDRQTHRARQRYKERKYIVESGEFLSSSDALLLVAVTTRVQ